MFTKHTLGADVDRSLWPRGGAGLLRGTARGIDAGNVCIFPGGVSNICGNEPMGKSTAKQLKFKMD